MQVKELGSCCRALGSPCGPIVLAGRKLSSIYVMQSKVRDFRKEAENEASQRTDVRQKKFLDSTAFESASRSD